METVNIKNLIGEVVVINHQPCEIQSEHTLHFDTSNLEKVISEALSSIERLQDRKPENKSKGLAKLLRRDCKSLDMVVQSLLKKERDRHRPRKIGQETLESCLLHQTANLLYTISDYIIPHLERSECNKNQHT